MAATTVTPNMMTTIMGTLTVPSIMAIRGMNSVGITNFESIMNLESLTMANGLNTTVKENLDTVIEGSAIVKVLSAAAGMRETITANA